jgi:LmbE family N-acetylglucosaminyl deacetylase
VKSVRILVVFAHPDDETMLVGGTLALLEKTGADVHYLAATRGEGGDLGKPPLCTRAEVGFVREKELVCAVNALGGSSLRFMNYVDPLVGENDTLFAFAGDDEDFSSQVISDIQQLGVDAVITHGSDGEYGHPAHLKVHRCVKQAVFNIPEEQRPLLYTFQGAFLGHPKEHLMNQHDPAHIILDIHAVEEEKLAAITCHKTQHDLFLRHAQADEQGQCSLRQVLITIESLHRVFPPVTKYPITDKLVTFLTACEGMRLVKEINNPEESLPDHH